MTGKNANIKFTVLGGDNRLRYLADTLRSRGFETAVFAFGEGSGEFKKNDGTKGSILILPLPTSKDGNTVFAPFAKDEITFDCLLAAEPPWTAVFGGMLPDSWRNAFTAKSILAFDYYEDEELIRKNARLTAEAVLGMIIEKTPDSLCGMRVCVTGFGRCGKELARLLKAVGAQVTVVARSPEQRLFADFMNCTAIDFPDFKAAARECQVLVNTIPAPVIGEEVLAALPEGSLVLEIASIPYGVDFCAASKLGVNAVNAGSLPGKTAPRTAGILIAETILVTAKEAGLLE